MTLSFRIHTSRGSYLFAEAANQQSSAKQLFRIFWNIAGKYFSRSQLCKSSRCCTRSNCLQVLYQKAILESVTKFTEKHSCLSLRQSSNLQREPNKGVFLWILQNILEQLFVEYLGTFVRNVFRGIIFVKCLGGSYPKFLDTPDRLVLFSLRKHCYW